MAFVLIKNSILHTFLSRIAAIVYILVVFTSLAVGIDVDYLTTNCNNTITAKIAGVIEPESRLFYSNNVDCTATLKTSEGRLLLQFYRFALEDYVDNECVDKLVVYDGQDTNNSLRLTDDLCGRILPPDVESTTDSLTFKFKSDDDGQAFGFGIFYTVFKEAPCSGDDFKCDNNKCISSSLVCDSYDMCGDNSDEVNCEQETPAESGLSTAIIFAILVGSICFVIGVIFIIYYVKEKQRQKKLTEQILKESVLKPSDNNYCDKDFWGSS